jgi:hypothetical protein
MRLHPAHHPPPSHPITVKLAHPLRCGLRRHLVLLRDGHAALGGLGTRASARCDVESARERGCEEGEGESVEEGLDIESGKEGGEAMGRGAGQGRG